MYPKGKLNKIIIYSHLDIICTQFFFACKLQVIYSDAICVIAMEKPIFDLNELAGGVAVITGGGSGLGLALAHESAKKKMHVVISDIREKEGIAATKSLQELYPNLNCSFFHCDVTKIESVRSLLQFTKKSYRGKYIQFLAANAGVMLPKCTVLSGTYDEWKSTYNVNVLGIFNTVRCFKPSFSAIL